MEDEREVQATIAGILKPMTVDAGAVVRSSAEDEEKNWLETIPAEMVSVLATGALRKVGPREVKSVQARGCTRGTVESGICSTRRPPRLGR